MSNAARPGVPDARIPSALGWGRDASAARLAKYFPPWPLVQGQRTDQVPGTDQGPGTSQGALPLDIPAEPLGWFQCLLACFARRVRYAERQTSTKFKFWAA